MQFVFDNLLRHVSHVRSLVVTLGLLGCDPLAVEEPAPAAPLRQLQLNLRLVGPQQTEVLQLLLHDVGGLQALVLEHSALALPAAYVQLPALFLPQPVPVHCHVQSIGPLGI